MQFTLRHMVVRRFRNNPFCTFALVATLLFPACGKSREDGPTPVISGAPSTAFPMPPIDATSISELGWIELSGHNQSNDVIRAKIGDYRHKVLVLDMYATWCAPCRKSIPQLLKLQRQYRERGLEVVGLNVGGPDDRLKVPVFSKELDIDYKLGFPDRQLTDLLMSDDQTIPQTFVFDRQGTLVQRFIGYDEVSAAKLEKLLQTLM